MSTENAKATLKILGVLSIIFGVFGIFLGVAMFSGGRVLGFEIMNTAGLTQQQTEAGAAAAGTLYIFGGFTLIAAAFDILLGVFSAIGANNQRNIMPAFVLAIIALVLSCISLILSFVYGITASSLIDGIVSLIFSGVIYWAANTLRRDNAERE